MGVLSFEFWDVRFNILQDESSIYSYEVSWGSCRIGNCFDVCSCFHPPWLLRPLWKLPIQQINGFWFSAKEIREFEDGIVKEIDACGGFVIDGNCRIGLSGSKRELDNYWDVGCWIESHSSCCNCSYFAPTGSRADGSRRVNRSFWFDHLEYSCLGNFESIVDINKYNIKDTQCRYLL